MPLFLVNPLKICPGGRAGCSLEHCNCGSHLYTGSSRSAFCKVPPTGISSCHVTLPTQRCPNALSPAFAHVRIHRVLDCLLDNASFLGMSHNSMPFWFELA